MVLPIIFTLRQCYSSSGKLKAGGDGFTVLNLMASNFSPSNHPRKQRISLVEINLQADNYMAVNQPSVYNSNSRWLPVCLSFQMNHLNKT